MIIFYQTKLQNKVKLIGYLKNPYNYIKKSDIVILTSKFEGLPNILLEAQYLKKYIISTNCETGPREIRMERLEILSRSGIIKNYLY